MRKLRIIMKQTYPTFSKSVMDLNPNGFSLLKSSESLSVDFYENGIEISNIDNIYESLAINRVIKC